MDFGDPLLKANPGDKGPDDPLWDAHESPFIRWLIEKWTATGMTRFGALQAEMAKWIMGKSHVAAAVLTPRPPVSAFAAWTPAELKLTKAYLESLAPGTLGLDDWLLVVDYLYQRYCPEQVMRADAEMLAVRAHVMGRVEANFAKMSAAQAESIAQTAPTTVKAVMRAFPAMTEVQKATLEYGNAKCCEYVVQLTDNARADMRKLIVDYQEQVALGGTAAPREALQTRLLDRFGTLNRDWRRIAVTEAGNNALNGMIATLPYGTKVMRIEQYRSACSFCRKWHEAVFEVVDPANPKKDGKTQIWIGKTNIGRSNSPRKKSGAGLVERTEEELWWPTVALFHVSCRGRWVVIPGFSGGGTELRKSKPWGEKEKSEHPRLPDGTFADVGKIAGMEKRYLSDEAARDFYLSAIKDRTVEKKAPLGKLTNLAAISAAIGKDVVLEEVILQASYLAHVHDFHGVGGFRKDSNPIVAEDMLMALAVINGDKSPEFTGKLSCAEQPLVKFSMTLNGVTYKVIGEIRPGRRNRNVAVYNFYKR